MRLLQPYLGRRESDWYRGTADAVFQNLACSADWRVDSLLILSGDHIYKMDYNADDRRSTRSTKPTSTVAVMEVPMEEAHRFGTHGHRR